MSPCDPRTRDNPEAAMVHAGLTDAQLADCLKNPYTKHQDLRVHQPSAAFFDLPLQQNGDPTKWEWPTSESRATSHRHIGWHQTEWWACEAIALCVFLVGRFL